MIRALPRAARALALAALLAAPAPALAQRAPSFEPIRPFRTLAVGNVTHLRIDEPATTFTAGLLYQRAFRETRMERLPAGNTVQVNPRWFAHLLGTAGFTRIEDELRLAGFAQLGAARRNDSPTFTTLAFGVQAMLRPRALGPFGRVEIMDNIGLQAGWAFDRERSGGLFISIDFMRNIVSDLGLGR